MVANTSSDSDRIVFLDDEAEEIYSALHRTEVEDRETFLGIIY